MSAAAVIAIVLFLFFLAGGAAGVLVVMAVSARRAHKAVPQVRPVAAPPARGRTHRDTIQTRAGLTSLLGGTCAAATERP